MAPRAIKRMRISGLRNWSCRRYVALRGQLCRRLAEPRTSPDRGYIMSRSWPIGVDHKSQYRPRMMEERTMRRSYSAMTCHISSCAKDGRGKTALLARLRIARGQAMALLLLHTPGQALSAPKQADRQFERKVDLNALSVIFFLESAANVGPLAAPCILSKSSLERIAMTPLVSKLEEGGASHLAAYFLEDCPCERRTSCAPWRMLPGGIRRP